MNKNVKRVMISLLLFAVLYGLFYITMNQPFHPLTKFFAYTFGLIILVAGSILILIILGVAFTYITYLVKSGFKEFISIRSFINGLKVILTLCVVPIGCLILFYFIYYPIDQIELKDYEEQIDQIFFEKEKTGDLLNDHLIVILNKKSGNRKNNYKPTYVDYYIKNFSEDDFEGEIILSLVAKHEVLISEPIGLNVKSGEMITESIYRNKFRHENGDKINWIFRYADEYEPNYEIKGRFYSHE